MRLIFRTLCSNNSTEYILQLTSQNKNNNIESENKNNNIESENIKNKITLKMIINLIESDFRQKSPKFDRETQKKKKKS